ncbi:MAG: NAD(P)H-binding protein [Polyangiaceae bacterium]|nr:NAD(P)H-binding protein [Polyangiaceae bacterium]
MTQREHDVLLWGATGFTGRLVADYLAAHRGPLVVALGGRNRQKLEAVRREVAAVTPSFADAPIVLGDATDPASLADACARSRVVLTTVGPYYQYGKELARAAAAAGCDYCDLTGEVTFWRWLLDEVEPVAKRTGARLVPSAGFDSIPSDLGVAMLAAHAMERHGRTLSETRLVVTKMRGGVSGGTLASAMGLAELARKDAGVRALLRDPYALSPDRARDLSNDGRDPMNVRHDADLDVWTAPFVMGAINTRVVRRSNAARGHAYGKEFSYGEWMSFGSGARGFALANGANAALLAFLGAAALPPTRMLLERVLPGAGEGPSAEARQSGFFHVSITARMAGGGPLLVGRVEGKQDPGYGATAKMISETAMGLLDQPGDGGVHTTAVALGDRLITRLRRAGMTFVIEERP